MLQYLVFFLQNLLHIRKHFVLESITPIDTCMYTWWYFRRYARWFGHKGDASPKLASYALNNVEVWEKKIEDWQTPVLDNR